MFYDQNPPPNPLGREFPNFGAYVTVATCWYYLSLLESFVDATMDMPEDVLKLYLVRAEYRYFKWFNASYGKRDSPVSTPPPIGMFFFFSSRVRTSCPP